YTGLWTIDGGRASIENITPAGYLASSYYRRWFLGLERRVVAHGLVGEDEIKAGKSLRAGRRLNRKLTAADAKAWSWPSYERRAGAPARFKAGDRVRARNLNPTTHTPLPRYARGKLGTVEAVRGRHGHQDPARL